MIEINDVKDKYTRNIRAEKLNMVNPVVRHVGQGTIRIAIHGYCRFNHMSYGAIILRSEENPVNSHLVCKRLRRSKYFSDIFEFTNLSPGRYTYQAGMFMLPKSAHRFDQTSDYIDFVDAHEATVTLLDDDTAIFRFGMGSCRFFLNIFSTSIGLKKSDKSYRTMDRMDRIQAFMMLGDSVYMDIVKWLPYVRVMDRLEMFKVHRRAMSTPGFKNLFSRIPYYPIPDDHEYRDDANPLQEHIEPSTYNNAREAINTFVNINGPLPMNSRVPIWAEFVQAGIPFFAADTRYERDDFRGKIMSNKQMNRLKKALSAPRDPNIPFFIMSAAPFALQTKNNDTWAGYKKQQESLIRYIHRKKIKNVFFLTGDSHCSMCARFRIYDKDDNYVDNDIVEIMSSGLYQLARDSRKNFNMVHKMNEYKLIARDKNESTFRSRIVRRNNFAEVKVDKVKCEVKVDIRTSSGVRKISWRFPLSS